MEPNKVKAVFKAHFPILVRLFRYLAGTGVGLDPFTINRNKWNEFFDGLGVIKKGSNYTNQAAIERLFVAVNLEADKGSEEVLCVPVQQIILTNSRPAGKNQQRSLYHAFRIPGRAP